MEGCHQLWTFAPVSATVAVLPGIADEGLRDGGPGEAFFAQPSGSPRRVSAAAAACDGDGVFAACHLYRQEWLVDVRPVAGGPAEIVLDLDGDSVVGVGARARV